MKKGFEKIPRTLRGILFHLIQWVWGLPQNLLGLLLLPVLRGRRSRYHGALVTVYESKKWLNNRSGFSLGTFIFIPEAWSEYEKRHLLVHEYGHTVQSLMLGPLYLFVVGLPSVIWSKRFERRRRVYRSRGVSYTDRFPENGADRLGEYVTGEKPY
ncbi:MAG: hypothetical protein J6P98_04695 [Clostridia bacterium]|nr:hypothetical protein [Clostridia bacterium]